MMNQDTRRLSKMPDAVRAEISPWFLERSVMEEDDSTKRIPILDDTAPCRTSGLMVRITSLEFTLVILHLIVRLI
jgi:fatty acyl-ACP thioesterase B